MWNLTFSHILHALLTLKFKFVLKKHYLNKCFIKKYISAFHKNFFVDLSGEDKS